MQGGLRRLAREPLVHFALIGVGLFAIDGAVSRDEPEPEHAPAPSNERVREPIVVDADVRATLASEWSRTHATAPSAAELDAAIERFIDDEVLYREGLARGLADGDPDVRKRVASQMTFVLQSRIDVPTPDDAQLRSWFDAHSDRYARPTRIDFTQVFVAAEHADADARAAELLRLLQSGADPNGLGDTFAGGRRFRGRKLDDLRARFGDAFVAGLDAQPEGAWSLRRSPMGLHVVRVDRRDDATAADFEAAREEVLHDWQEDFTNTALQRETRALRDAWKVVIEP